MHGGLAERAQFNREDGCPDVYWRQNNALPTISFKGKYFVCIYLSIKAAYQAFEDPLEKAIFII